MKLWNGAVFLGLSLVLTSTLTAADPDVKSTYPRVAPLRERVLVVDAHSSWTLRKGEAAVPLAVVSTPGRTVVSLTGGWLLLGPDLEFLPSSFDLLGPDQPLGSPWTQAVGNSVLFVTGSPGDLAVLYPDTAVIIRQRLNLAELSHFAVTDQGFLYVQGRRASGAAVWGKGVREGQPLPFFPADMTTASDGMAWATDSLQSRPWRQEEGYWQPLEAPKISGRMTSLTPYADSTGYFASGQGWVGSFSSDGTPYWVRDRDLSGQPLPRDLKLRSGAGRLYLWSALARKVWCWAWDATGPEGTVGAPSPDRLVDQVRTEIDRLESLGSVPEAQAVAQYGIELTQALLKAQPFSPLWSRSLEEFSARRQALRERVVGAGVFVLNWSAPFQLPLATWNWEPDAAWLDIEAWRVTMKPYWEGRAYETDDFRLAPNAELTPWPGAQEYRQGPLRLPSWMSLELRPDGSEVPVHWTRVLLPVRPIPYDLPVE